MYTFSNIVGNETIIDSLKKSIENNRVTHAYIFSGLKGIGKKLLAKTFAKTLQCEKQGSQSCNECISCKTFESNNHTDIFYVRNTNTKSIGVDDIREQINQKMEIKPYKYKYKIFIVENAEKLTVQAQNALLKTIEEPAGYGIFMLLTDNANTFLPTVLSRCVRFNLMPLPFNQVCNYLINHWGLEQSKAEFIATFAQGNIGQALDLMEDEEFISMRNTIITFMQKLDDYSLVDVFEYAKELEAYKDRIQEALDILNLWYRDLLVTKIDSAGYLIQKDLKAILQTKAKQYSVGRIVKNYEAVNAAKRHIKQYANFLLTLENLFMSLYVN